MFSDIEEQRFFDREPEKIEQLQEVRLWAVHKDDKRVKAKDFGFVERGEIFDQVNTDEIIGDWGVKGQELEIVIKKLEIFWPVE